MKPCRIPPCSRCRCLSQAGCGRRRSPTRSPDVGESSVHRGTRAPWDEQRRHGRATNKCMSRRPSTRGALALDSSGLHDCPFGNTTRWGGGRPPHERVRPGAVKKLESQVLSLYLWTASHLSVDRAGNARSTTIHRYDQHRLRSGAAYGGTPTADALLKVTPDPSDRS